MKQLELYVEIADSVAAQARATSAIGTMYNTLVRLQHPPTHTHTNTHTQGDYERSVEFFRRCYELSTQLNDPAALHEARVQYGIARGHQMFKTFSTAITTSSGEGLERLIAWKDEQTTT